MDELQAVRMQHRLVYLSGGCLALLLGCALLENTGLPVAGIALLVLLLLCPSIAAQLASVFQDRFYAGGCSIMPGHYSVALAMIRLGGMLAVGPILLLTANDTCWLPFEIASASTTGPLGALSSGSSSMVPVTAEISPPG